MKRLIKSNLLLTIFIVIFAIILSEILVYIQLQFFSIKQNSDVYTIGFWTPLIDSFFVIVLVLYFKSLYEKELKETNTLLEHAKDIAKLGEWKFGLKSHLMTLSEETKKLLGLNNYSQTDNNPFEILLNKNDWLEFEKSLKTCIYTKKDFNATYKIENPLTQKSVWFEIRGRYIARQKAIVGTVQDITENYLKEQKISQYINLIDKNIITSSTSLDGTITDVSEAFCKISGYSKEELIGKKHNIVRHPDMPSSLYEDLWQCLLNNKTWQGEIKNSKKDNSYYWVKATIYPIFDENNNKIGYTAIREDITDKKKIEELSIKDDLTGLFNKRHFNELFPKIIRSAKRDNRLVCFMMMDVDYFKKYNDTYGHQLGDIALEKIGHTLLSSMNRADDYCFRLGGEEFGIIFHVDEKEKAYIFANNIRQNIENLYIEHRENNVSKFVTVSMGLVCQFANEIDTQETMYKQADDLLYQAKHAGRNIVMYKR